MDATSRPTTPDEVLHVEEHLPLVIFVLERYYASVFDEPSPHYDIDDLIQVGALGLMRARATWDPARGSSWSTWAVWQIRGALTKYLRNVTFGGRYTEVSTEEFDPATTVESHYAPEPETELPEGLWSKLTVGVKPRHAYAAFEHLVRGRTLRSIARDAQINVTTAEPVRQLVMRARRGLEANARREWLPAVG